MHGGYAEWQIVEAFYDVVRIDHFRGFLMNIIPFRTEIKLQEFGHWEKGPGMDLFRALEKNLESWM